jgi:hypothetical protein
MSTFLKEFEFEQSPSKIKYFDGEPLQLTNEFIFFHNKSKFRQELNQLQYLIKSYTNVALHAAGIRNSYLKEEYFDRFLLVILTTSESVKKTNEFLKVYSKLKLNSGCFYLHTTSKFMLLLSKDMEGLKLGLKVMETVLKQVLEDYMNQMKFDDYIKICSFELSDCIK